MRRSSCARAIEAALPRLITFATERDRDGNRHFWGAELLYAPNDHGQEPLHVGTLERLWNLFDLTPEGRPDWHEQLSYT